MTYLFENNVEKKALGILSVIRNLNRKYPDEQMEVAAKTLLEVASQPTLSVYKGILDRNKKKSVQEAVILKSSNPSTEEYGFTRGAKYFGGDNS